MILGFLFMGIMLGYWTVKSAIDMPVNESNQFQLKYQIADMSINDIIEAEELFDSRYRVESVDFKLSEFKPNEFLKRSHGDIIALSTTNKLSYKITSISGEPMVDMNATLLLTRPHIRDDDKQMNLVAGSDGIYTSTEFTLANEGRYTLRLRIQKDNAVKFLEHEAYLKL